MNQQLPEFWAVIPAAGVGKRMLADRPKQYLTLSDERSVLWHTLQVFLSIEWLQGIVLVLGKEDEYWPEVQQQLPTDAPIFTVDGGKERADSVLNGLNWLQQRASGECWVMVHDAARPNVQLNDIERLRDECLRSDNGGILAAPVRDTMKRGQADGCVQQTVDRNNLWHALTPQCFPLSQLRKNLQTGLAAGAAITDEASAIELQNGRVLLVEGPADNLKITRPEDLALARFYLRQNAS